MKLTSPAFEDGEPIPRKYGYTEQNVSPPLRIESLPGKTSSLALVMDDPDAVEPAGKIWDHWVVWNIDPEVEEIAEGEVPEGALEGTNDYGEVGYGGPNPPDGEHTYVFTLYALDTELDLDEGATKDDLESAIEPYVLGTDELRGTYEP